MIEGENLLPPFKSDPHRGPDANREGMAKERRRYIRPEALNLLDYLVVDQQGRQGEYAMGRTLNVSQGGILMETHIPLPVGQQVMITLGLEDQLIDVMGRIIYDTYDAGRHQNGIEFFHVADDDRKILNRYVEEFHRRCREQADLPDLKGNTSA